LKDFEYYFSAERQLANRVRHIQYEEIHRVFDHYFERAPQIVLLLVRESLKKDYKLVLNFEIFEKFTYYDVKRSKLSRAYRNKISIDLFRLK
jgi:hypothetical protein